MSSIGSDLPRTLRSVPLLLSGLAAAVTIGATVYGAFIAPNGETAQGAGFVVAFASSAVGLVSALLGAAVNRPRHRAWTAAIVNLALGIVALGIVALAVAIAVGIHNMNP